MSRQQRSCRDFTPQQRSSGAQPAGCNGCQCSRWCMRCIPISTEPQGLPPAYADAESPSDFFARTQGSSCNELSSFEVSWPQSRPNAQQGPARVSWGPRSRAGIWPPAYGSLGVPYDGALLPDAPDSKNPARFGGLCKGVLSHNMSKFCGCIMAFFPKIKWKLLHK